MGKGKLERFSLAAIADALDGSDIATARDSLSQLVGAVVEVSGTVQKRVKRDGQCKLVIEPGASRLVRSGAAVSIIQSRPQTIHATDSRFRQISKTATPLLFPLELSACNIRLREDE
jgi:hypothetical protein